MRDTSTRATIDGLPRVSGWAAAGAFALLTIAFTWPQAIRLFSVPEFIDTTFSMWRIAWIAHQLPVDPRHLFDANAFYPMRHALAFSDAVLLEGVAGAPLLWLGAPTVLVYNLLILAGFILSGVGAFLLVRDLTESSAAGLVGGVVFAFAPFRFDHYVHLELLWAQWIPLAMWMLHRTLRSGRWRDGLWTGVCVGLQGLSCIYYTVFLATVLLVAGPILLTTAAPQVRRRAALSLLAGAVLAAAMLVPYANAYQASRAEVGERAREMVLRGYSAGPKHYLATPPGNLLYGQVTAPISVAEKRLFMGFLVVGLMVVGLWPPLDRTRVAYAAVLAVALDISFAHRGLLLTWLYDHVAIYRGLRVPARIGQLALLSAAVLSGFGVARLMAWTRARRPRLSLPLFGAIVAIVALEYAMRPQDLVPVATTSSESSAWLRQQPPVPIANLPVPRHDTDWRRFIVESRYEFESTFHWRPMTNGYSGFLPPSFYETNRALQDFPSDTALARLRELGVGYALVHERYYGREDYAKVVAAASLRPELVEHGPFADGEFETRIYSVLPMSRNDSGAPSAAQIAGPVSVLKDPAPTVAGHPVLTRAKRQKSQ
jgi:hypothetical protein